MTVKRSGSTAAKLGHVPIIRRQKRGTQNVEMDKHAMDKHEKVRYRERTGIKRAFSRLNDELGFSMVRVRGVRKVLAHLMFGILALTADQIQRWCGLEGGPAAPS
jgi:transposase